MSALHRPSSFLLVLTALLTLGCVYSPFHYQHCKARGVTARGYTVYGSGVADYRWEAKREALEECETRPGQEATCEITVCYLDSPNFFGC